MKSSPLVLVESIALKHLAWMCEPIVCWAVKRGFGHKQISRLLKPIFLRQAEKILTQQGRDLTDSALALTSGLHRADVQKWQTDAPDTAPIWSELSNEISLCDQVLANWALGQLPPTIPYKSGRFDATTDGTDTDEPISFSDLIQLTPKVASHGFSAHLILQEMVHRGLVTAHQGKVTRQAQTPADSRIEAADHAMHHLCAAQKDLLSTGLHNIQSPADQRFLEESIEVDGLHPSSVKRIHEEAQKQWSAALANLLPLAHQLSDQDEPQGGQQRLRLGIYFYTEELPLSPTKPDPFHITSGTSPPQSG